MLRHYFLKLCMLAFSSTQNPFDVHVKFASLSFLNVEAKCRGSYGRLLYILFKLLTKRFPISHLSA